MEQAKSVLASGQFSAISKYTEKKDALDWITEIDDIGTLFGWSNDTCLAVARCKLGPQAKIWYKGVANTTSTWDAFKCAFKKRFALTEQQLYEQLRNCKQNENERVVHYADRFKMLMNLLNIKDDIKTIEYHYFIKGLRDEEVIEKVFVMRKHFKTIHEATDYAVDFEENCLLRRKGYDCLGTSNSLSGGNATAVMDNPRYVDQDEDSLDFYELARPRALTNKTVRGLLR